MWEDGIPIEFGFFHVSPWNNMREITFWNYFAPENPEEIKNLTKLDYLYLHEKLDKKFMMNFALMPFGVKQRKDNLIIT